MKSDQRAVERDRDGHERDDEVAKGFEYFRALSITPVSEASFEFWGLKWGLSEYGAPGGTVTYSFAPWTGATQMLRK